MQLETLQLLDSRWPNDKVLVKRQPSLSDGLKIISTPTGHSAYEDNLTIDEQDKNTIMTFAAQNNFAYSPKADVHAEQYGTKLPAWLGLQSMATQPLCVHQVSGKLHGYDVTFFLAYTPSSVQHNTSISPGIRSTDLVRKSIIRVKLPKVFPQMVLDSNKNDKSHTSTIPAAFKDNQRLQLEGNFGNYFDFYAPRNLQVNALTVLAPNFMQIVMESATMFDVEFYGDELVLITREPIYTTSVMAVALQALEAELQYLSRLLPSWNYQPLQPPFDLLEKDYFDDTVVKIGGLRIKPGVMLLLCLLGFVAFACLILILK